MRYLRDVMAGAGATDQQLVEAAQGVEAFLVERIKAEIQKLGSPLPPNLLSKDVQHEAAIDYLRHLKTWRGPVLPDFATIDAATFEIEKLLAEALKAEALKRLLAA